MGKRGNMLVNLFLSLPNVATPPSSARSLKFLTLLGMEYKSDPSGDVVQGRKRGRRRRKVRLET